MGYKKYIRVLGGNKALARNIGAFIKRRDKLTRVEWEKNIKPLMKQTENEVLTKLRSNDLTTWGLFNLKTILADIQNTTRAFTQTFRDRLVIGMTEIAEISSEHLDDSLLTVKLRRPSTIISGDALIANQIPMTESFISFFGDDMAKIIQTEIGLGLSQGESILQVTKRIKDKFKSSNMSYARAERIARTEMMTASSIANQKRSQEVAEINPDALKIWIHNPSQEPRESHIEAQERYKANPISINKQFHLKGLGKCVAADCMFPRDLSLPACHRVNCKCTTAIINRKDLSGL